MAAKKKTDPFVRCFEVSEPRLHEKGHTIYKVTLKVRHFSKFLLRLERTCSRDQCISAVFSASVCHCSQTKLSWA